MNSGRSADRPEEFIDHRIAAAAALRSLGHAVVGHYVDPTLLGEITAVTTEWKARAEAFDARRRARDGYILELEEPPIEESEPVHHFPDCSISGAANPLSMIGDARRDGDAIVLTTTLGAAYEGAPGRAHGGIIAAIFDDVMGFVVTMRRAAAYQGELTIRYVAPTPVLVPLEIRAWPTEFHPRRLVIEASISAGGEETAHARGNHVLVAPERLVPPD